MNVVDLLYPDVQRDLRAALEANDLQIGPLQDETIAALTTIGGHPPHLRTAALAILPLAAREELLAYRLLDVDDEAITRWTLSDVGRRAAEVLHQSMPAEDRRLQQHDEARAQLAQLRGRLVDN
ncbi:MAG: hypothetical protein JWR63_997 [Conexibacter sp.]|nr:hypothetical protein [Conexibacter sp.]